MNLKYKFKTYRRESNYVMKLKTNRIHKSL